jgi:hypothetical protein
VYASNSSPVTEHLSLIEAACKVPKGILSARQLHRFTTQSPHQIWMAIAVKAWAPRITSPPVRFIRMSGPALHFGVKEYPVRGGMLKVYTPAKTVADCFKFPEQDRNGCRPGGPTGVSPPQESPDARWMSCRLLPWSAASRTSCGPTWSRFNCAIQSLRTSPSRFGGSSSTSPESGMRCSDSYSRSMESREFSSVRE